jgi:quercetin dioxygenase-like cupin family protein
MNRNQETFDVLGVALQWKLRGSETGGMYCVLEAVVPPGVMVPPHQHMEQEAFFMLEGTGEFASLQDGELRWASVGAGEMVNIPSDAVHGFRNTSNTALRCLITGHATIENFFAEAGTPLPSADAIAPAPSMDDVARVLRIAERHGQRFLPPQA